jgi:hypothetical protein
MKLRDLQRSAGRLSRALSVPDHWISPPPSPYVLFSCHDADRSMVENGKRYSPLLESIRQIYAELGYGALNLSHPLAVSSGRSVKDGSITLNYRSLQNRLRLMAGRAKRATNTWTDLEEALFADVLNRLRPELIVAIQPPLGMCRAARRLGIGVVEPMHATQLSLTDKIFVKHMRNADTVLPNVILAFDDVTQATLESLCAGRSITPMRANDPWRHSLALARARAAHAPQSAQAARPKQVLVTLQWGYDGDRDSLSNIIPNGILHPALEAAFAAPESKDIRFLVRMHPIQMTKPGYRHHLRYIQKLAERLPNVEYAEASARPMPLLLDEVDAHITMSSASVGNAAAVGVQSLALCPTLHEGGAHFGFFRELEASGMVTFGSLDTAAILSWIAQRPRRDAPAANDAEQRHGAELAFYRNLMDEAKALGAASAIERAAA